MKTQLMVIGVSLIIAGSFVASVLYTVAKGMGY